MSNSLRPRVKWAAAAAVAIASVLGGCGQSPAGRYAADVPAMTAAKALSGAGPSQLDSYVKRLGDLSIVIHEDGTVVFVEGRRQDKGVWDQTEAGIELKLTDEDGSVQTILCQLDGDLLTFDGPKGKGIFRRMPE